MQSIILAAGKGTRMRSGTPKVLHPVLGRPVLGYVLKTLASIGLKQNTVVIGHQAERLKVFLKEFDQKEKTRSQAVLQPRQNGTGHAVMMTASALRGRKGNVLIWPGDMPLVERSTLKNFIDQHRRSGAKASVLTSIQPNPSGYGRILRAGGKFFAIREELDASERERAIQEVNTGVYLFDLPLLFKALKRIRPVNKKSEYYLTDTIEELVRMNCPVEAFPLAAPSEGLGINSRQDLAKAVEVMMKREMQKHMAAGVTFEMPELTYVAPEVKIGEDTVIHPWCYIEAGVRIGKNCKIGPYAKLNRGVVIEDGAVIGSFVEVNRSKIGKKVYAKHLAYIGDAVIGEGSNIGAGTITANYDGTHKHQTKIGKKVFVGSNTVFVAPVRVGDSARTGAGSVVTAGTHIQKGITVAGVPAKPLKKKRG